MTTLTQSMLDSLAKSAHFNTGSQMRILRNTLSNQTLGGILMYQLYYGFNATAYGPLPSGFYLQLEN